MSDQQREAQRLYLQGKKYKEIAEALGLNINTIKSWKSRLGWQREKVATNNKKLQPKTRGAPKGNKNAVMNTGGAPKGNSNAATHGMFRNFMPDDEETRSIYDQAQEVDGASMLYEMILIKFTNIIRAQKIMFVRDQNDITKEVKKTEITGGENFETEKTEYEIQFAWDKQAAALTAQARAMNVLQNMIEKFIAMTYEDDSRRLKLVKMQQDIDIAKERLDMEKDGNEGASGVIILNDKEAMKQEMERRMMQDAASTQDD